MSYCRWSSDDWKSDLYCYEDTSGGWTTHVAGSRRIFPPDFPKVDALWNNPSMSALDATEREEAFNTLCEAHRNQLDMLELCVREAITLPYAGETFNDPTIEEFLERIKSLIALGYHVPEYVIPNIEEEIISEIKIKERAEKNV